MILSFSASFYCENGSDDFQALHMSNHKLRNLSYENSDVLSVSTTESPFENVRIVGECELFYTPIMSIHWYLNRHYIK